MELLFRLLGIASWVNNGTSRYRVNLIPFNFFILVILGFLFGMPLASLLEAMANGNTPASVTLTDVISEQTGGKTYVQITGDLHIDAAIGFHSSDNENAEPSEIYVPLTASGQSCALLVRMGRDNVGAFNQENPVTLTGIVGKFDSDRRKLLEEKGSRVNGYAVDSTLNLNAGDKPGDPILLAVLTVLAAIPLLLMTVNICMRYLVFHPQSAVPSAVAPDVSADNPILARVTGNFALGDVIKRFQRVPAVLLAQENGTYALVSNIDASPTFYGVKTKELSGFWVIVMRPEGKQIQPGRYYFGLSAYPALRVSFVNALANRQEAVVLAFDSEEERQRAMQYLTNPVLVKSKEEQPVTENSELAAVDEQPIA